MDAKELRVGNLLRDKITQTELRVIEIKIDGFTTYVIDRSKYPLQSGWVAEPIPLTEEWLLKFGFEKHNHIQLGILYQKSWLRLNHLFFAQWRGISVGKTEYIHQLQNLYFALTGEELTIK